MCHLFYCSGLKSSTSTALLVGLPSKEACVGLAAVSVGAFGGGDGGVADGGLLVGDPRANGPAAVWLRVRD